ncbi:hypothetical protein [Limimaricola cinnabarinus]|uniref:hypothetical protein n=1 Tax=Limimaricola cinnabarinus TaxID=1125964 RepID=UPI00248FC6F8|nr:hypothetical protein [Limimaricola cinnabarinus]
MRRRRTGGSTAQTSSGSIGVISWGIEGLHQRDQFPQAFNAQLQVRDIIKVCHAAGFRDQKRGSIDMDDLEKRLHVACPRRYSAQQLEAVTEQRMTWVTDFNLSARKGTITVGRGDIPIDPRRFMVIGRHPCDLMKTLRMALDANRAL